MHKKNRKYNSFSNNCWQHNNSSMHFVPFSKDPFVEIDWRITKRTNNFKANSNTTNFMEEKDYKVRRVYKRNIAISVILSILTFGIYNLFWQYEIAKETNALSRDDSNFTPCLVVVFSILTLGIYGVYWSYCIGRKHSALSEFINGTRPDYNIVYLVLSLASYLIPLLQIVCYGFMQSKINKMIFVADMVNPQGVYVRDSSVFNKPFLSAIILLLISQEVPSQLVSIYEFFFRGQLGNPLNILDYDDISTAAIKNSAEQVVNANSWFMIVHSVLSIAVILGVLLMFKLVFRHQGYSGVLTRKNFKKGCVIILPAALLALLNLLGTNLGNFKIGILLLGFVPAFTEEITFRAMIVPNFLRIYNKPAGIWIALFFSAGVFGLMHYSNLMAGANFGITSLQVFYAFGIGMIFAAVLIRTGNLWPCIIVHGLIDTLAMMSNEAMDTGMVQTQTFNFSWEFMPLIVIGAFLILCGIILCRPKKHKEILNLWREKWGIS